MAKSRPITAISPKSKRKSFSEYSRQLITKHDPLRKVDKVDKADANHKNRKGSTSKPNPSVGATEEKEEDGAAEKMTKVKDNEKAEEYRRRKEQLKRLRKREKLKHKQENLQAVSAEKLNKAPPTEQLPKGGDGVAGQENGVAAVSEQAVVPLSPPESTTEQSVEDFTVSRHLQSIQRDWRLSQPLGGRFSDVRPLFSKDEKYLLLAQSEFIKIYSLKTSQLVRTLPFATPPSSKYLNPQPKQTKTTKGAIVVGFAYHPGDDDKLYALTANGDLWLWDWKEGMVAGWWKTNLDPSPDNGKGGIAVTEEDGKLSLWTYERKRFSERKDLHLLRKLNVPEPSRFNQKGAPLETSTVHAIARAPKCLRVLDPKTFVLIYGKQIVVGHEHSLPQDDSWGIVREIPTQSDLTCMDVVLTSSAQVSKKASKNKKKVPKGEKDGSIVVGDATGVIQVYSNILGRTESDKMTITRLHWHREAVGSVQWSLDGTYILSGGKETVLVIWQVATSRRQFLPHLSGPVEDILVSPRGRNYGVRLGDNSVMVLSTTELKPQANISGIQSRIFSNVSDIKEVVNSTGWRVPCAIHPLRPSQLLLAVPSSQLDDASSPYLQTFDVAADRSISRQALTRTLVTQKNVAPDGTRLKEPTVKHLAISADGLWLATVDEWAAPAQDFVDSAAPPPAAQKKAVKEVFLRFWRWNGAEKQWELVTRMDDPHASTTDSKQCAVHELIASPRGRGFVSVGEDGNVKFWKFRARTRAGVKATDPSMVVWGCRNVTEITKQESDSVQHSRLAYSADESVLAVSTVSGEDDEAVVSLIDPDSGTVRHTINSLKTSTIFALAIVDRFLVVAGSERLVVWNLVTGKAQWGCELSSLVLSTVRLDNGGFVPNINLAADQLSGTFAIAINYPSLLKSSKTNPAANTMSQVTLFSPLQYKPLLTRTVRNGVMALKSISNPSTSASTSSAFEIAGLAKGYIWVDGKATLQFLGPRSASTASTGVPRVEVASPDDRGFSAGGLSNSYKPAEQSNRAASRVSTADSDDEMEDDVWDGVPRILRSDALARLFPGPAYASPALEDVFEKFMGMVGEKPREARASGDDDGASAIGAHQAAKPEPPVSAENTADSHTKSKGGLPKKRAGSESSSESEESDS